MDKVTHSVPPRLTLRVARCDRGIMSDPIPSVDQLLDTTTMRRLRRRRDMLPDLAVCAALVVLAGCVIVAAAQSLTAGLGVLLLAVLALAALWALTSERGMDAWCALLPPLVATWAWLRAMARRGRHRRSVWRRRRAVHSR